MDILMHDTPDQYAQKLAKYIKDPSTIRARTIDEYGEAPSIKEIERMQKSLIRGRNPEWHSSMPKESDGEDFRVKHNSEYIQPNTRAPIKLIVDKPITPKEIIQDIAYRFNLNYSDISGSNRYRNVANVRHLVAALLVARGNSRAQVGRWLGGRDHTTIINSLDRFREVRKSNPEIDKVYREYLTAWNISTPDSPRS